MGLFGNLFNSKSSAYQKFEKLFSKVIQKQVSKRDADQRNAYLTGDLLSRRKELANDRSAGRKGAKRLILDFGTKGETREYSLAELNKMAKAGERAEAKFKADSNGATLYELLAASDKKDIQRSHQEIKTAALYKIHGNMLYFRVSAGPDSAYTHHQVKVRLEEWNRGIHGFEAGRTYLKYATEAATGRMSFTCDCGRHRYWYRYLATIGNFCLDPFEHVFPKIRNKKLKGCCCKHMIKVLATLRMTPIHMRLAKELEDAAKKKGFVTKLVEKLKGGANTGPKETYLNDGELATTEQTGTAASVAEMQKAFKEYKAAQKGFTKKMSEAATQKALRNLKVRGDAAVNEARTLAAERDQLKKDILVKELSTSMALSIYRDKMTRSDAIKKFAKEQNMPIADATELAKQVIT